MIPHGPELLIFKEQLRESLKTDPPDSTTIRIAKHRNIYLCGDVADSIHFIESGQVKLVMLSPEGKQSLLSIHIAGDTFGELCLAGVAARCETAFAMDDTMLRRIPCRSFFAHLKKHLLLEGFVQYLATRVAEQQQIIASLVMVDSEHRLGETLLQLARKLGQRDPRSIRIEQKITHEELSEMVGTTRPRVTQFLRKFRNLGLINLTRENFLIVHEQQLLAYLTGLA